MKDRVRVLDGRLIELILPDGDWGWLVVSRGGAIHIMQKALNRPALKMRTYPGALVCDVPDGAVDREMFRSFLVVYQEKSGAESVYLRFAWDPTILRGGNLSLMFASSGEPGLRIDLCQGGVRLKESTFERSRQR
ncbi:hypothetical protein B0T24DRAFT_596617 [Lasiosphaeria ovina]|uniref:Uncharacterized protein n=1 Tax=Lasiosphaeria ovina TaxID=92902 RepID=A0AAE0JZ62_9PEZI|nr:hypothetical protein B0T24DRAFT_596617 [Lasiosphaeria ovina]